MAASPLTVKFGKSLNEVVERRTKLLNYKTKSAYVKGLVRYDGMVAGDHSVTLPLSNLSEEEQERVDDEILALVKQGIGKRGQLLKRLIELVKEEGKELTGEAAAEVVRKRVAEKKKGK